MFLVLEPRVHGDAQDLDMVFGLHGLSLDGEWLLVRFIGLGREVYNSCYFAHWGTGKDSVKYLTSMVLQRNNWSINITNISGMVVAKIRRNQHPLSRLVNHVTYAYTAKWGVN